MREWTLIILTITLGAMVFVTEWVEIPKYKAQITSLSEELGAAEKEKEELKDKVSVLTLQADKQSEEIARLEKEKTNKEVPSITVNNSPPATPPARQSVVVEAPKPQIVEDHGPNKAMLAQADELDRQADELDKRAAEWKKELIRREQENWVKKEIGRGIAESEANMGELRERVNRSINTARSQATELRRQAGELRTQAYN